MSASEGLLMAARIARHQAGIARARGFLEEASTADALAREFDELGSIEATDPMALVLWECTVCGASTPACWEPPKS